MLLAEYQQAALRRQESSKTHDEARRWNMVAHNLAEDAIWFKRYGGYAG